MGINRGGGENIKNNQNKTNNTKHKKQNKKQNNKKQVRRDSRLFQERKKQILAYFNPMWDHGGAI